MKITFLSKTRLGTYSIFLTLISMLIFIVLSLLPYKDGYSGFDAYLQNPMQGIGTVLLLVLGIAAPVMGLIAVVKKQERSVLVFFVILSIIISPIIIAAKIKSLVENFIKYNLIWFYGTKVPNCFNKCKF